MSTYGVSTINQANTIERKKSMQGGADLEPLSLNQIKEDIQEKAPISQISPPKFTKFSELKKNITMTNLRRINSKQIDNNSDTSGSIAQREVPQIIIRSDDMEA